MPLEPYVQACVQDRCQCPQGTSCACSTVAEFSRQCSHAGGQPGTWRNATLCRECRSGAGRAAAGPGAGRPMGGVATFTSPRQVSWCAGQELHLLTTEAAWALGARHSRSRAGARAPARRPRARPAQGPAFALSAKSCPGNMVYLESGSPCMDTCSHLEISSLCEEHRMDGCFCPDGECHRAGGRHMAQCSPRAWSPWDTWPRCLRLGFSAALRGWCGAEMAQGAWRGALPSRSGDEVQVERHKAQGPSRTYTGVASGVLGRGTFLVTTCGHTSPCPAHGTWSFQGRARLSGPAAGQTMWRPHMSPKGPGVPVDRRPSWQPHFRSPGTS